jgi:hypothetical protein
MTREQVVDAICDRFDHLTIAKLRGVHGAEALSDKLFASIQRERTEYRRRLHDFAKLAADHILSVTPSGHEPALMAAGVINSFLKYAICISQGVDIMEVRAGRMETWYDDIPQPFLQGNIGQDHGSMGAQLGKGN